MGVFKKNLGAVSVMPLVLGIQFVVWVDQKEQGTVTNAEVFVAANPQGYGLKCLFFFCRALLSQTSSCALPTMIQN